MYGGGAQATGTNPETIHRYSRVCYFVRDDEPQSQAVVLADGHLIFGIAHASDYRGPQEAAAVFPVAEVRPEETGKEETIKLCSTGFVSTISLTILEATSIIVTLSFHSLNECTVLQHFNGKFFQKLIVSLGVVSQVYIFRARVSLSYHQICLKFLLG